MKNIIVAIVSCLWFSSVMAQTTILDKPPIPKPFFSKIEIMAGPSLSFLRGSSYVENNDIISRSLKLGYSFGIGLTHPINRKLELTVNVLFERKGTIASYSYLYFDEATQTYSRGKARQDFDYQYRSLPIIISYSIGKKATYYFGVGTYVSYLKSHVVKTTSTHSVTVGIEDQIMFDRRFDFGCVAKISCAIPLNQKISFQTQLLNVWGLANTRADPNYGIIKTNNTNLLFGIIIT